MTERRLRAEAMSCPTCGHEMHIIAQTLELFWCPRCGTISTTGTLFSPDPPALVERVRDQVDAELSITVDLNTLPQWVIDLRECVYPPENLK